MADLIDRAALLEWLGNCEAENDNRIRRKLLPKGLKVTDAIYMVNKIPAVDAVEVIRCKDCNQWMYEFDNVGLCIIDVPEIDGVQRLANDFCSYGERKET